MAGAVRGSRGPGRLPATRNTADLAAASALRLAKAAWNRKPGHESALQLGLGGRGGLVVVLNDLKVQRARSEDGKRTGGRLRVWIDCFFIDQLSKKITVELAISQEYYILCLHHIIAGSNSLLDRGWCLWELGLRAYSKKKSLVIGKLQEKVKTSVASLNTSNTIQSF